MFVPASTVDEIGVLDADRFSPIGWGAEIDYGLRARATGLCVVVTGLAYLHHDKTTTGKTAFAGGLQEYAERGFPVLMEGLRSKWGEDWQRQAGIDPATNQTTRPSWRTRLRTPRRRRTSQPR
jgi:GT2 family glycosyltransferase